jgi:fructose-1,6-bisphosphatase/inositol monophosphatase family enzyme
MSHIDEAGYDIKTLQDAMRAASDVFRKAGDWSVRTKPDGSFVTDIDLSIQQAVLRTIDTRHGDDLVIAEEGVHDNLPSPLAEYSGRWWGVDPIDGTTNFVSRFPVYCVSIGLCDGREPIAGAIWDPNRDHLHCSWNIRSDPWPTVGSVGELRVGVEFEGPGEVPALAATVIRQLVPTAAMVRVVGCAALGLAWVSMGWLDAFFHPRLAPWDYAAGSALVTAAGGVVSSPCVGLRSSWVLAGSPSAFSIMSGYIPQVLNS